MAIFWYYMVKMSHFWPFLAPSRVTFRIFLRSKTWFFRFFEGYFLHLSSKNPLLRNVMTPIVYFFGHYLRKPSLALNRVIFAIFTKNDAVLWKMLKEPQRAKNAVFVSFASCIFAPFTIPLKNKYERQFTQSFRLWLSPSTVFKPSAE